MAVVQHGTFTTNQGSHRSWRWRSSVLASNSFRTARIFSSSDTSSGGQIFTPKAVNSKVLVSLASGLHEASQLCPPSSTANSSPLSLSLSAYLDRCRTIITSMTSDLVFDLTEPLIWRHRACCPLPPCHDALAFARPPILSSQTLNDQRRSPGSDHGLFLASRI